nr:MAG TPA: hypothetical protein [Caudoviricetes sp.]
MYNYTTIFVQKTCGAAIFICKATFLNPSNSTGLNRSLL